MVENDPNSIFAGILAATDLRSDSNHVFLDHLLWQRFDWSGRSVLHHRTGLSTIRTLIKTGSKILRTGTEAKFRPFVDALGPRYPGDLQIY